MSDSGLVIEFALKAAVCTAINKDTYPEEIRRYRTHDPETLIDLSKLRGDLESAKMNNLDFFVIWSLLSKLSINFRYMPPGIQNANISNEYINAMEEENGWVYPCIKKKW